MLVGGVYIGSLERWWKGVCKRNWQRELELLVRRAIDEIDDDSRSNSCKGFGSACAIMHKAMHCSSYTAYFAPSRATAEPAVPRIWK